MPFDRTRRFRLMRHGKRDRTSLAALPAARSPADQCSAMRMWAALPRYPLSLILVVSLLLFVAAGWRNHRVERSSGCHGAFASVA